MCDERAISHDAAAEAGPSLGWARRILRRQLDALARLAAIALRKLSHPAVVTDPADPFAAAQALSRAVSRHARASWALRLIEALRAKLSDDLRRVERGEAVTIPPASDEPEPPAGEPGPAAEVVVEPAAAQAPPKGSPSLAEWIAAELESLHADVAAIERGERPAFLELETPETERFETEDFRRDLPRADGAEFADILKRPTEEIIALICRELDLPPGWLQDWLQDWLRGASEVFGEDHQAPEVSLPMAGRRARPRMGVGGGAPPVRAADG